ncbi:hypothetical protein [Pandoravirus japonicus]|uniref:Uncharacterized protein n=1 Tax=Pandoravirus japonicus TaxID=2823154 RepID=A0A811BR47_9VIRU|nr:hypothetical protein [Pandoravirus japonicus]
MEPNPLGLFYELTTDHAQHLCKKKEIYMGLDIRDRVCISQSPFSCTIYRRFIKKQPLPVSARCQRPSRRAAHPSWPRSVMDKYCADGPFSQFSPNRNS